MTEAQKNRSPAQLEILAKAREKAQQVRKENAELRRKEKELAKAEKEKEKAERKKNIAAFVWFCGPNSRLVPLAGVVISRYTNFTAVMARATLSTSSSPLPPFKS